VCCESCIRYEKCLEDDQLKDNCCPKCPEFNECGGTDSDYSHNEKHVDAYDEENY
jgi:hypothetical protein